MEDAGKCLPFYKNKLCMKGILKFSFECCIKTFAICYTASFLFVGCGPSAEEMAQMAKAHQDSLAHDSIKKLFVGDTLKKLNKVVTIVKIRHWSSAETGLPKGVIEEFDCSKRGTKDQNAKDNYITIRKDNGISTIVRDVDEDLFLNISTGDIIE